MRAHRPGDGDARPIRLTFRHRVDPSIEAEVRAVRQLLGLEPGSAECQVVYGLVAANGTQIAMLSRSMLEIWWTSRSS
jgi:hypothetical protein